MSTAPIHLAIVEDDAGFRRELAAIIGEAPGIVCRAALGSAEELLAIDHSGLDVILLDVNLPRKSGVECAALLRARGFAGAILMLTVHEDPETIFAALKSGASGYLLKRSSLETIVTSIRDARDGGSPVTPRIARRIIEYFHRPQKQLAALATLTTREREVLDLLATGQLYKQVAARLGISLDTVRHHVRNIYEKLQVNSRSQALAALSQK